LRRVFFFTCALRRFIFCELRRSNLPMAGRIWRHFAVPVNRVRAAAAGRRSARQPALSATASSRLRTSRR
jgi:hypothetical protein